jgi:hypothetical protein
MRLPAGWLFPAIEPAPLSEILVTVRLLRGWIPFVILLAALPAAGQSFDLVSPPFGATSPPVGGGLSFEPFGAEDLGAQDHVPRIPEPLVFDLVRPLGARRGELEVNTLALIPLGSFRTRRAPETDPFGPAPLSKDRGGIEWAPEIEYAVADGFALEFELPFEEGHLESYKFAGQYTFGTAFENRYIHGTQVIVEPDVNFDVCDLTLLYLAGVRFDETWSVLAMFGGRTAVGSKFDERTEMLFNFSIFADITEHVSIGVETNHARKLNGTGAVLLMPQVHWEITDQFMIQSGVGVGFLTEEAIPTAGLRVIYSW